MSAGRSCDGVHERMLSKPPKTRRQTWQAYTLVDPDTQCSRCGYSLAGIAEMAALCPECGSEFTPSVRVAEYLFYPLWYSIRDVCAVPGALGLAAAISMWLAVSFSSDALFMACFVLHLLWFVAIVSTILGLVAQLFRTRAIRRGVRRQEHLARLGIAAAWFVACTVAATLAILSTAWLWS